MKKITLKVNKRTVLGKKVKRLRRDGILPATIYGKDVKSVSVQVPIKDFYHVYKEVGETGLVELSLDSDPTAHSKSSGQADSGQGKPRPVLIKNVQLEPKSSVPLHADFYQVNLSEKIKANVPVEPVGEPKAVLDKTGVLEIPLSEVEVEALPADLPEKIEVDVANLAAIGDQITVADVKAPSGVTILTDAGQILFKIGELITKEAEELAKAEEAAKATAAAQAAPAEGEVAPAQAPAEEEKPQEAPKTEAHSSAKAGSGQAKPEEKGQ